eukprot:scaffold3105_cov344-Ochromonas_danica.AAC.2
MTSKQEVVISREAYLKIGLHLSKYYYAPVLGYLLGNGNTVVDILPICHSVPAGPTLEICGEVAEKLSSGNNQKVVGLYYASASPSQKEKPVFLQGLLRNLKTILSGDAVFLQANHALLADNTKVFLEASTVDGQRLERRILGDVLEVNQGLNHLLKENKANVFADYEDHVQQTASLLMDEKG